ncbi:MAG: hemerythrin domain-containing protein [Acidobacteria bacterium]|nr:MAG: hemerythrin domain-containing protein [Acidobacteriota bacterium]
MVNKHFDSSRRLVLRTVPAVGLGLATPALLIADKQTERNGGEEEVTPTEDLMREHGLLKRILLIYDEVSGRIDTNKDFPPDTITNSAKIIRSFVEQYHEKLEEDHLFPRFRKSGKLVELVDVLQQQHQAGRRVTESILAVTSAGLKSADDKRKLRDSLHGFVRMYAPHEAREDTVLFPAVHEIVSKNEYDAMGEDFEKREHDLFGKEGFEGMVPHVAEIERQLGIYDLNQFTPR